MHEEALEQAERLAREREEAEGERQEELRDQLRSPEERASLDRIREAATKKYDSAWAWSFAGILIQCLLAAGGVALMKFSGAQSIAWWLGLVLIIVNIRGILAAYVWILAVLATLFVLCVVAWIVISVGQYLLSRPLYKAEEKKPVPYSKRSETRVELPPFNSNSMRFRPKRNVCVWWSNTDGVAFEVIPHRNGIAGEPVDSSAFIGNFDELQFRVKHPDIRSSMVRVTWAPKPANDQNCDGKPD